ncbi:MAG: hypothetical protein D6776_10150 [Planctomycetota bacterium]|nr:MAG: hypothetical protein D6776_10150 [Planctomycetota bacterium]
MAARSRRRRRPQDEDLHDPEFAALAPRWETFPGFEERDFAAFTADKQRSAAYNAQRLVVKRKLAALVKQIAPALEAADLPLEPRTSLSHPCRHNGWRVRSMWGYFGRSDAEKRKLKRVLGAELGADADPAYQGVILLVEIDAERVAHGLRIHPGAWWDARRLQKQLESPSSAAALLETLRALPVEYAMGIGGWKRRRVCAELGPATLQHALSFYRVGEHWFEVLAETPREQAIAEGPALADRLGESLAALAPLWRTIAFRGA